MKSGRSLIGAAVALAALGAADAHAAIVFPPVAGDLPALGSHLLSHALVRISPAPEPPVWAMMIVGAAAIVALRGLRALRSGARA